MNEREMEQQEAELEERIEARIIGSQKPKVDFMLLPCHMGITGCDLTADRTNLEVLMLWNLFEAIKHHVGSFL